MARTLHKRSLTALLITTGLLQPVAFAHPIPKAVAASRPPTPLPSTPTPHTIHLEIKISQHACKERQQRRVVGAERGDITAVRLRGRRGTEHGVERERKPEGYDQHKSAEAGQVAHDVEGRV